MRRPRERTAFGGSKRISHESRALGCPHFSLQTPKMSTAFFASRPDLTTSSLRPSFLVGDVLIRHPDFAGLARKPGTERPSGGQPEPQRGGRAPRVSSAVGGTPMFFSWDF